MTGIRRVSQLGTTGESTYVDGSIVNADIAPGAAISVTKLAPAGSGGQVLMGGASGMPTYIAPSGDATIDQSGVVAIGTGVIVNADINASAAIAQSKIANLTTDIANAGGLVYITSATASGTAAFLSMNGCFSATYDNYKVIITRCYSGSTANIGYQMMDSGGNPLTTASYSWGLSGISSVGGSSNTYSNSGVRGSILDSYNGNSAGSATYDVLKPFLADQTAWFGTSIALNSGSNGYDTKTGVIFVETGSSYTGFRLIAAAGNISCTATVYGYRK